MTIEIKLKIDLVKETIKVCKDNTFNAILTIVTTSGISVVQMIKKI